MWILFLFVRVNYYTIIFLWWCGMTKCLCDEIKWDEWCRHCDTVLDYYWAPDNMSEGGSSASDVFGSLSHDDVNG